MAKRIQLSSNDVAYYTLPGNSAELRNEAGELTDTIYGQNFASGETGLINWTLNSNALYKGFAGYIVSIKKSGTPTGMVAEAMSLVSGKIYQITASAKRVLDPEAAVTVLDNAVNKNDQLIRIDYLNGIIEFDSGYTVTGPVTITANYLPLTEVAGSKSFSLSMTAETIDETDIPTAKANGGFSLFSGGLKTVSLELQSIYRQTNLFQAALVARDILLIEINPDNNGKSVARGFFKYLSRSQAGDVGALEEETIGFQLYVPDIELMEYPFHWTHANDTTLNNAIKIALTAWEEGTSIYMRYLPDGSTGYAGGVIVTDVSLSGGLEAMNEFTINLQGNGVISDYAP